MDMALLARRIVEHGTTKHIIKVFQMENGYNRLYLEIQGHVGRSSVYESHAAKLLDLRRQRDLIDAQIAAVSDAMTYLQELAGAKEKKQARATRQTQKATTSPARRSKKHPKTAS